MKRYRYLVICVFENGHTLLDSIWKSRDSAESHVDALNAYEKENESGNLWSVKEIVSYE